MHWVAFGLALLLAFGIIGIGLQYILSPRAATRGFGLAVPEVGANTDGWLRIKGIRDIASGLAVLALMTWGAPAVVGILLLALTFIPLGDMLLVLTAKDSARNGFVVHAVTAVVMVVTAFLLIMGAH